MVYACNGFFAILWNFQLQHSGILTCNFRYFYLTTNRFYEMPDNGVFVTRYKHSIEGKSFLGWAKFNKEGKKLFDGYYPLADSFWPLVANSTSDGGFMISGGIMYPKKHERQGVFFLKLDNQGKIQWKKIYRGDGTLETRSVHICPDGRYLVSGTCNSQNTKNCYIALFDRNGDPVVEQILYSGRYEEWNCPPFPTNDGGAVAVVESYQSSNPRERYMVKFSPNPAVLPIKVFYNNNPLSFDTPPVILSGRLLVPIRPIAEAMGAKISWEPSSQTISLTSGDTSILMTIGETFANVNGIHKQMDVPTQSIDGYTLVPLRFIGEAFGADVTWSNSTRTAFININTLQDPE
jgi:hypothetical protein